MKLELKSGTKSSNVSIMRKLIFLPLLLIMSSAFAQTKSDDIIGSWITSDGERKISVYKQNEKYYGKIVWVKNSDKKDEVGKIVIKDLEFDKGEYDGGSFIIPTEKHSADCAAILKKGNMLQITIYHGMKIFGHSNYLSKTL